MARPRALTAARVANASLRVAVIAFAAEAVLSVNDPRFTGKGIAVRDLILAGAAMTLLIPAIHAIRGRNRAYPIWADSLVLSILVLDMAGNSFNLYALEWRFDLIPHAYGPGAAVVALHLLGVAWVPGALVVNAGHVLLEVQEVAGDVLFGTHNVHGWWDTLTDLAAGATASFGILMVWRRATARWSRRSLIPRNEPAGAHTPADPPREGGAIPFHRHRTAPGRLRPRADGPVPAGPMARVPGPFGPRA